MYVFRKLGKKNLLTKKKPVTTQDKMTNLFNH